MAGFGWSVGDLIKGVEISAKIYLAFADGAKNANKRFGELVNEFGSFQSAFEMLVEMLQKHKQPVGFAYKDIQDTLKKCQTHLQKYDAMDQPFSTSKPGHAIHKFVLMVKFPFDDAEWDRLRQELAGHTRIVNMRIQSLILEQQFEERIKNMEQRAGIVDIRRMVRDMHDQWMTHGFSPSMIKPPPVIDVNLDPAITPHVVDPTSDISLELAGRQAYDTLLRLEQSRLLLDMSSGAADANVETEQLIRARKEIQSQNKWLQDMLSDDISVRRTRLLNLEQRLPNVRRRDTYDSTVMSTTTSQVPSLVRDDYDTSPMSIATGQSPFLQPGVRSIDLGTPASPSDWPSLGLNLKDQLGVEMDRRFSASSPPEGIFLHPSYTDTRTKTVTSSPDGSPRQTSTAQFAQPGQPIRRRSTLTPSDWKHFCSNVKVTIKGTATLSCGSCLDACDTELLWTKRSSGGKSLSVECAASRTRLLEHKLPSDHEPVSYIAHRGVSPTSVATVAFNVSCPHCSNKFNDTKVCGQVKLHVSSVTPIKEGPKYCFENAADHQAFQELIHGMSLVNTFDVNQVRTDSGAVIHSETLRVWKRIQSEPSNLWLMSNASIREKAPKAQFLEPKDSFVPLSKSDVAKDSVKIRLTIARPTASDKGRRYSQHSLSSLSSGGSTGSAHGGHERPKWIEFEFHTGADRRAFCQCWHQVSVTL